MMRRTLSAVAVALLAAGSGIAADPPKKPNVLFIAVDDLNHWVGHLGRNKQTKTPNIDRLAKMGVTFTRAYCAAPVCNPSRAALMSGLRPGSTGVYDNGQDWQPVIPKAQTLTTQFLKAGYDVSGPARSTTPTPTAPASGPTTSSAGRTKATPHPTAKDDGVGGIKFKPLTDDSTLPDEAIVDYGIKQLAAKHDKPFFLAVGLHKPHMPWNVPKKYYDLFPLDTIELPPTQKDDLKDVPAGGIKMAKPDGDHAAMLKSGRWKEAVQAYLAAIAYCDAQIGRLLDAYDKSPHKDNTDHRVLGRPRLAPRREGALAEVRPVGGGDADAVHLGRAGRDEARRRVRPAGRPDERLPDAVRPVRHGEAEARRGRGRQAAAARPEGELGPARRSRRSAATTTRVRTERWRYIRYADGGEELYDHDADPYEWTNLAGDPKFAGPKTELRKLLPAENKPELPREKGKK